VVTKYTCPCDENKNQYRLKIGKENAILIACKQHAKSLSEFKTIVISKKFPHSHDKIVIV